MKKVLSTRNLSNELIDLGHTLNLDVQGKDFIEVNEIPFDDTILMENDFDSVVFTSSYAARALVKNMKYKDLLKQKNIFSLGGRTADILLKAGIKVITVADNSAELADKIIEIQMTKGILHPGGNLTLDRLKTKMSAAKIACYSLTVYHTTLNNLKLENDYDAVMFYSPSGVESFFHSNKLAGAMLACAIGKTTAAAIQNLQSNRNIIIPIIPSVESMLEAIANYFKKRSADV